MWILRGLRKNSETTKNKGTKFLLGRAKWGIYRLLSCGRRDIVFGAVSESHWKIVCYIK